MRFYNRLLAINLCRLALGGQTVKNLHLPASKFELDQTPRKFTQVGGQTKRKLNASPNLRRLAGPFGQGFNSKTLFILFVRKPFIPAETYIVFSISDCGLFRERLNLIWGDIARSYGQPLWNKFDKTTPARISEDGITEDQLSHYAAFLKPM